MTFIAPGYLVAALVAATCVIALHLLVAARRPTAVLPTARFLALQTGTPRRVRLRPSDLALLGLRIAIVLLIGAALARPFTPPPVEPRWRVVALDVSRATRSMRELADSAARYARNADVVLVFDTVARVVPGGANGIGAVRQTGAPGSISVALVAASQTLARRRVRPDTLELVLVSPIAAEEIDAATGAIRDEWPGRLRVVRLGANAQPLAAAGRVELRTGADDPLADALAAARPRTSAAAVRIVRAELESTDTGWARKEGHVLVHWPLMDALAGRDSMSGVYMPRSNAVVVGAFTRGALPESEPAWQSALFWLDGRPAAVERATGDGCIRIVSVDLPRRGDLVLRPGFGDLVREVVSDCGGAPLLTPAGASSVAGLALDRSGERVTSRVSVSAPSAWPVRLLLIAFVLALLELVLRNLSRRTART